MPIPPAAVTIGAENPFAFVYLSSVVDVSCLTHATMLPEQLAEDYPGP
jgi:hypothetical protein